MFIQIIIALGLSVIFTENPNYICNVPAEYSVNGCYWQNDKAIYLTLGRSGLDRTFYHELGHAMFLNKDLSRVIIKGYKPLKHYTTHYDTEYKLLNERVADYFVEYALNNKEFSVKYPSLYIYFRDEISKL